VTLTPALPLGDKEFLVFPYLPDIYPYIEGG